MAYYQFIASLALQLANVLHRYVPNPINRIDPKHCYAELLLCNSAFLITGGTKTIITTFLFYQFLPKLR